MRINIIGAKLDLGAGRRGVDMGPSALRIAKIREKLQSMGHEVEDSGNLVVPSSEEAEVHDEKARYAPSIASCCGVLAQWVMATKGSGDIPLVMGGDHSIAVGTIKGMLSHYLNDGKKMGVVWIDAHADMNTPETSPSGNVHGMPLATCLGKGPRELLEVMGTEVVLDPKCVALVGIRLLDQQEKNAVSGSGVNAYTMSDIDKRGIYPIMEEIVAKMKAQKVAGIHVSFDVDSMDPSFAPGVGTTVPGGLSYRETHLLMEMLADSGLVCSLEITEINPILDIQNQTAEVAAEMICSAVGKTIL